MAPFYEKSDACSPPSKLWILNPISSYLLFLVPYKILGGSPTSLPSSDSEAAKNGPVSKANTLLKDMLKLLQKDVAQDEAIRDKMPAVLGGPS